MFYQIAPFFKSIFIHILYFYVCLQEKNERNVKDIFFTIEWEYMDHCTL